MLKFSFKTIATAAIITSALLPWNATAIDRADQGLAYMVTRTLSIGGTLALERFGTSPEDLLVKSLLQVGHGQLQQASDTIDQLLSIAPNFKLAQLVRGDLLMARAQQFQAFGNPISSDAHTVDDFREEARKRIERHLAESQPSFLPEPIWQMNMQQHHVIVVDTEKSRLYVYRNDNGKPTYLADFYATIGRNGSEKQVSGDKRTPIGVYFASSRLPQKLADLYGVAAYPLSYPNEWDKRQGKSGHGIWLHGTPSNTYSRPPRASDGCVVLSNPDLKSLEPILQNGDVPVIIANNLQWLNVQNGQANQTEGAAASASAEEKEALRVALERWRQDWQSQNSDHYLSHYSEQFSNGDMNYSKWASEKRRIQASKPLVDIKLSNVSMFRYPNNQQPMAVVTFDQRYKSPYLESDMRKRQYWIYENKRWKIIYEGEA